MFTFVFTHDVCSFIRSWIASDSLFFVCRQVFSTVLFVMFSLFFFITRALWRCSPAADHCCTVSRPPYRDFLCQVWTTQFTGCVIIQHTWTQSYRSASGHHNEACSRLWRWAVPPSAVLAVFLHHAKATVVHYSSSDEQLSVHVVDVFDVFVCVLLSTQLNFFPCSTYSQSGLCWIVKNTARWRDWPMNLKIRKQHSCRDIWS